MDPALPAAPACPDPTLRGGRLFARVRPLLAGVQTPAWYIGGEVNEVVKDAATVRGRIALIYPDNYAIGMSHYGLKLLYHIVNLEPDLAAERCFTPFPDFADRLRAAGLPLHSLETKTPLRQFDVLAFTLQAELTQTNVLETLALAGWPLRASPRRDDDPVVIAGGAVAWNPQPLAEVIDLVVVGDGEETIVPLLRLAAELRRGGMKRRDVVVALARRFSCAYAPGLWEERRTADGRLAGYAPTVAGLPDRTRGAYVYDLDEARYPTAPIVPHTRVVHDRISIEVMRGCVHGCRFCPAGMITRPWRLRSPRRLAELARESYLATGVDEIGLLSLSTSDYPYLQQLIPLLREQFSGKEVHLSLPSLRVNEQLKLLPFENGEGRKGGLTLAPEVATDRLRQMVNKPIRNEDLYAGVRKAFCNGYDHVKLYFMIGVPGEIESDVDGIVEMAENCARIGKQVRGRFAEVHAAVSTFVPKPFVPYQWDAMLPLEEIHARQRHLRSIKRMKVVRLDFHRPEQSFLEAILARGDRRVGAALLRAHELGARFDEWGEHFDVERWRQAFADVGIDWAAEVTRPRAFDEPLPWDGLDAGPTKEYLVAEAEKARAERSTQNCFGAACNKCGVDAKDCFDLKHAMPLLPMA